MVTVLSGRVPGLLMLPVHIWQFRGSRRFPISQPSGFRAKPAAWLLECGVTFDMDGQIMTDNHRTANPKIFAGGDAVRGADLAVRAFADGRDAAEEILRTLTQNMN